MIIRRTISSGVSTAWPVITASDPSGGQSSTWRKAAERSRVGKTGKKNGICRNRLHWERRNVVERRAPRNGARGSQGSFPLGAFPFELQRGVGVRKVLVRARAFVDGLKERSTGEGIQIFDFGDAAWRRKRVIGGNGDVADLNKGGLARD